MPLFLFRDYFILRHLQQMVSIQDLYEYFLRSTGVSTDTRKIQSGNLYIALKGANFNGNEFAAKALELAASYAIIDEKEHQINDRCILVDDALITLQKLAIYHREQLKIPVIAICGSNGKTTTKELTGTVLKTKYKTFVTQGNLNNHIGVPLSVLSINNNHEIAVLELGANHLGETAFLCDIAKPNFGLITNNGKDHLEGYGSLENVRKANGELYDYLRRQNGKVFVSNMQDDLMNMSSDLNRIIFGVAPAYFSGEILPSDFLEVKVQCEDQSDVIIKTNLVGVYNFENVMAACAIGKYFNVSIENIKKAIESYIPGNNRSQLKYAGSNKIIVDCYNANPSSMELAITNLSKYNQNTILIAGDMYELGAFSHDEHQRMLQLAKSLGIKHIWTVGKEYESANRDIGIAEQTFRTTEEMRDWLSNQNIEHAVILLKGSRAMRLEQLIEVIK